ncbi:hypothetical protein [Pectobacterium carotovorum]|uniref:hypothetical protein n=2 Tax=Pectobacterium carotovorum TaxID=554 RepID=UPI0001A4290B|nr:hypothetical protein [Pectobacterium carotovorum]
MKVCNVVGTESHEKKKLMNLTIEHTLCAKLALAITQKPRANLQQLASMVGVSKATLYRIAPTRELLIDLLHCRAEHHVRESLSIADLTTIFEIESLNRLIRLILTDKELYLFWALTLWMDLGTGKEFSLTGYNPSFLTQALEKFFLEGQQKGVFRVDVPATWLAKSLDYLLYAAAESAQRGEIASLSAPDLVEKLFSHGALK